MAAALERPHSAQHEGRMPADGDAATLDIARGQAAARPRLLLVGLDVDSDSDAAGNASTNTVTVVDRAAHRARVQQRPLVVALARRQPPWSAHPLRDLLLGNRTDAHLDAQRRLVREICESAGWSARVLLVNAPFAWTQRGRHHRWQRQLATLARLLGAELLPPDPHQH